MLIGHQKQWEFFERLSETGKISHAYLFSGQDKLGKKTLALEWISLLFNKDIRKNQHPDFILIEPKRQRAGKTLSGKKEIHINQIRDLTWKLSLRAFAAPFKAAIIDQAHLMNQEAQTSLLKTLEEPRGETVLILTTEVPESLFPTILSRTQTVKFYPVGKTEIKNYLKSNKLNEEESEEIAEFSSGRPGVAVDFILTPQRLNFQKGKTEEIIKILNSDLVFRFQYAKDLVQEPENLKEILDLWLSFFRKKLLLKIKGKRAGNQKLDKYSIQELKNILNLIQNTRFLVSTTNINTRLALETLMIEL